VGTMGVARFIEPEERQLLLRELPNTRDRLLVVMGLNTGLRVGSLLLLKWKQVWQAGRLLSAIEVPRRNLKGGRGRHKRSVTSRRIPINEVLRLAIEDHMRGEFGDSAPPPEEWVFRSRKRYPGVISRQHAHAVIAAAAHRAGLEPGIAPHGLRRSFAWDCYEASQHNLAAVQRLLGHARMSTTITYVRPGDEKLDDLVPGLPFRSTTPAPEKAEGDCRIFG
jgi:integrase